MLGGDRLDQLTNMGTARNRIGGMALNQLNRWDHTCCCCVVVSQWPRVWSALLHLVFSFSLVRASHQSNSVFGIAIFEDGHCSRVLHFTWYFVPVFNSSVWEKVPFHLQSGGSAALLVSRSATSTFWNQTSLQCDCQLCWNPGILLWIPCFFVCCCTGYFCLSF